MRRVTSSHSSRDAARTLVSIVRRKQAALVAAARRITGSQADAEDIVQDALLRGLAQLQATEAMTEEHMSRWLHTVVRRAAIDSTRRSRVRSSALQPLDNIASPECEPLARWRAVDESLLWELLNRLQCAPETSVTVRLRAEHQLSYQQISERLGIPTQTVGTRLNRAVRMLRRKLMSSSAGAALFVTQDLNASENGEGE